MSHAGPKLESATWVPECVAVVATAPPSEAGTLDKNLVKNLIKNLVKNLVKNQVKNQVVFLEPGTWFLPESANPAAGVFGSANSENWKT